MLITTISEIKAFWACPQRWYWQYVSPRRSPRTSSVALTTGTIWHEFMESFLNTKNRETAIEVIASRYIDAIAEAEVLGHDAHVKDLRADWLKLETAAKLWNDFLECETLAVEKPLALTLDKGEAKILGRPDRVIRIEGKIAHMQHKTIGGTKPIVPYINTFHRQPHEAAYWYMLQQEYGEDPFGCVLNLMRKLSPATITKDPQSALQQHPIPISREQAHVGLRNICATITLMDFMRRNPSRIINNPDRDLGQFGNSIDPWFEVLSTGDLSLFDDETKWKDTKDRYATEEVEA